MTIFAADPGIPTSLSENVVNQGRLVKNAIIVQDPFGFLVLAIVRNVSSSSRRLGVGAERYAELPSQHFAAVGQGAAGLFGESVQVDGAVSFRACGKA